MFSNHRRERTGRCSTTHCEPIHNDGHCLTSSVAFYTHTRSFFFFFPFKYDQSRTSFKEPFTQSFLKSQWNFQMAFQFQTQERKMKSSQSFNFFLIKKKGREEKGKDTVHDGNVRTEEGKSRRGRVMIVFNKTENCASTLISLCGACYCFWSTKPSWQGSPPVASLSRGLRRRCRSSAS